MESAIEAPGDTVLAIAYRSAVAALLYRGATAGERPAACSTPPVTHRWQVHGRIEQG